MPKVTSFGTLNESVTFMSITAFMATTFSSILATVIASWIIKKVHEVKPGEQADNTTALFIIP